MVPMGLSKHGKEPPYSWRSLCGTQVLLFNKGDGDLIRIDTALIRAQSGTAFCFKSATIAAQRDLGQPIAEAI
ncbi:MULTISPECIES: hypothetical protein [unclassified Bradyrhizobium]|uniref:hypothetical protein n=1 Tax=unclassified Bradyrhizobium TaxID=2631580 RepID=UPI001FFAF85C|nr:MULTISPECIES: hypothetical protein [unclassified Bradyrhizobium]MCK1534520.1 hypothetical protein [Bradyrhizobium sp. 176]MCK1558639.1 hypothetical protein [Bradyrhizobium sp. 171]